jgi:hypothetical protein
MENPPLRMTRRAKAKGCTLFIRVNWSKEPSPVLDAASAEARCRSRRRAATLPTCANGKLENGSRSAGAHEVAHRRPELDLGNRFVQQDQTALLRLLEAIRGSIASDQDGWNAFIIIGL